MIVTVRGQSATTIMAATPRGRRSTTLAVLLSPIAKISTVAAHTMSASTLTTIIAGGLMREARSTPSTPHVRSPMPPTSHVLSRLCIPSM